MGVTLNTAYKVQADLLESESNIKIENGTLHVLNNELKVHLNDEIKTIQTSNYQVFTALLTQNGGDVPSYISEGDLTIGVTYIIGDNGGSGDWVNVGSPNNEIGTSFIATGTTPNNWGINSELGYNTGAPVATVLENTIGNVWFTYASVGNYGCNSTALFKNNKSTIVLGNLHWDGPNGLIKSGFDGESYGVVATADLTGNTPIEYVLYNIPIEIRVYN